ncbi:ADP-ribosylglycohydrolase family protein [Paractinoplanes lichenicola]|uniref:ADP-ribosylglycohydrolase family protein n=1 Tax=Paractinoplanes lichenicola TaxID=2802976 RepID=A0ABS1W2C3_9ACTN|nr:ADP-ribosylglycohydrolase family protein [Actinoplanes lichenicola]MBL7260703.1 ADP-ribosylglycohydrolase family protein [Actinoplanes lichenicola]
MPRRVVTVQNVAGSLYGLAYGDALGKPTEFQDYATIVARYGPGGPRELTGRPALVTDDTQMALAVGEAMLAAPEITPAALEPLLRRAFLDWAISPDNNRAPGNTCLQACAALTDGRPWQQATVAGSKGCGANMRVTPVGLHPGLDEDQRAGLAQLQAGLTHGHPTGLAASELTAYACRWLASGLAPGDLLAALRERADSQRKIYREEWLGDLWQRSGATTPEDFIARGWDETAAALDRVRDALAAGNFAGDPCLATGEGWIAEDALATALYCYLISPDEPVAVLGRGAASSGDSDSIACLAGAFAGAALGMAAWPAAWRSQIEYTDRLTRIADAWDGPR